MEPFLLAKKGPTHRDSLYKKTKTGRSFTYHNASREISTSFDSLEDLDACLKRIHDTPVYESATDEVAVKPSVELPKNGPIIRDWSFHPNILAFLSYYFRVLPLPSGGHEYYLLTRKYVMDTEGRPTTVPDGITVKGFKDINTALNSWPALKDLLHNTMFKAYISSTLFQYAVLHEGEIVQMTSDQITDSVNPILPDGSRKFEGYAHNDMYPFQVGKPIKSRSESVYHEQFPEFSKGFSEGLNGANPGFFTKIINEIASIQLLEPPPVFTNNPEEPAYTFVNLTNITYSPTPVFDKWLTSIEEPCRELMLAVMFSWLVKVNQSRKGLYLRSDGGDGKSTLFKALDKYLGGTFFGMFNANSVTGGGFGMQNLIGRRVAMCMDCNSPNIFNSTEMHGLTGGDKVLIDRKFRDPMEIYPDLRVAVGSNRKAEVSITQVNQHSRMAYIAFVKPDEDIWKDMCYCDPTTGKVLMEEDSSDPDEHGNVASTWQIPKFKGSRMGDRFMEEMPGILYKMQQAYLKWCEEDLDIKLPPGAFAIMRRDCVSDEHNDLASFFLKKKYVVNPKYSTPYKTLINEVASYLDRSDRFLGGNVERYISAAYPSVSIRTSGRVGAVKMIYGLGKEDSALDDA